MIQGPRKPTNVNADVIFLVDSSSSVPQSSYQQEKDFVKQISKYLNVNPGRFRAAYVSYGDQARTVFKFNDYRSLAEYEGLVDGAPYVGGQRRMDRALDAASTLLTETRPSAPKIVVLLTAGRQSLGVNRRLIDEAAARLRDKGAKTYVIAIGAGPNKNELRGAVDRPEDIIPVRSFNKLSPTASPISRELAGGTGKFTPHSFCLFYGTICSSLKIECNGAIENILDGFGTAMVETWQHLNSFLKVRAESYNLQSRQKKVWGGRQSKYFHDTIA